MSIYHILCNTLFLAHLVETRCVNKTGIQRCGKNLAFHDIENKHF